MAPDPMQAEIAALENIISTRLGPLPLPPADLRLHVGARPQASNFLNQGWNSSRKALEIFGETPTAPILDWGCGSGRTLRWLLLAHPAWRTFYRGADVDREAIDWLREHGVATVTTCNDMPPLPYADREMGGIFSFSVLTHIHPERFRAWFAELARILKPGCLAYLTFNGDSITESKEPHHLKAAEEFRRQGWAWLENEGHYKSAAFASHSFIETAASGVFKVRQISRRGYPPTMDALYAEAL
jgi:SAM-dependent methyltransferase